MALNKLGPLSLPSQSITGKTVDGGSLSHRQPAREPLSIWRKIGEVYFSGESIIHRIGIQPNNLCKYKALLLQKYVH